jgi:hypothetical protein
VTFPIHSYHQLGVIIWHYAACRVNTQGNKNTTAGNEMRHWRVNNWVPPQYYVESGEHILG